MDFKWITSPTDVGEAACRFCREITVSKKISKAALHATAIGVYAPYLNGVRLGRGILAPGWTTYNKRVQYHSYDLTALKKGTNRLQIELGQGWAVGCLGYAHTNHNYADRTALAAVIDIEYEDGSKQTIVTDGEWEVTSSQITFSDIYHGQTVDRTAPIEYLGRAVATEIDTKVVPQVGEDIIEQERFAPVEVIRTPAGEKVIDFGQNLTGYAEIKIKAPRGSKIIIHHAEVLDKDGNFYRDNYRGARNECTYICSGEEETFKPTLSFQGFRYVRLTEFPFEDIDPKCFTAIAVHSDIKRTGRFLCGNEKINQLYHNVIWGQKSNYLDIPTDCPQRDERLGWTGDTQVFCRTGAINFDTERFFRKWLGDLALEQREDGAVAGVVPSPFRKAKDDVRISAAWGDAACIVPWEIYQAYGSRDQLAEAFPAMVKWVEYMHGTGSEEFLWLGGRHYGDWLAMDAGEDSYVGATSNDLIASAFFAYSTSLLVKAGEVLGRDMSEYRTLYGNVRRAFRNYFMKDGMPKEEFPLTEEPKPNAKPIDAVRLGMTQTALSLILHFDLCEEDERLALAAKLVELIKDNGMRMSTGFVGTPYILHALSENGYTDIAYELLFQERSPSWLYSVTHGATTMWEHWNSIKEDGSFWSDRMNSFNHYAYGAVYDWIFGVACGIKTVEQAPAYREISVAPNPDKRLGFAEASLETRSGRVGVHWYYKGDSVYYEITVPEGSVAHLRLPKGYTAELGSGIYHFAE